MTNIRILLILLILWMGLPASAQTPEEALATLLESKSIDPSRTAIYIWDLNTEYPVVSYQADFPLTPASIMKSVSTAALKTFMPYDTRLKTEVWLEGTQTDTLFSGHIVVKGGGDPSLGDGRHKDQPDFIKEIAGKIKDLGITRIDGNIEVDDSFIAGSPVNPLWEQGDLSQYYGTGYHAFNFEGNASGKASVREPSKVFESRLKSALAKEGITIGEEDIVRKPGNRKKIIDYQSPTLSRLMSSCMFRSDNLYAEAFMRLFGKKNGGDGSPEESARLAMQFWETEGYPVEGIEIVDGSGLSRSNYLTANFVAEVLKDMKKDPVYVSFFPLVGAEGTVRGFLKDTPLQEYMALKTGSMNGIQSYAGYMLDEDFEPTHVVVVMTNGLKNRNEFRAALSKFFLSVFR